MQGTPVCASVVGSLTSSTVAKYKIIVSLRIKLVVDWWSETRLDVVYILATKLRDDAFRFSTVERRMASCIDVNEAGNGTKCTRFTGLMQYYVVLPTPFLCVCTSLDR